MLIMNDDTLAPFWLKQIVFKPDGSQFNLRKMHCSLLPRRRFQAAGGQRAQPAAAASSFPLPPCAPQWRRQWRCQVERIVCWRPIYPSKPTC